jgi:hypothetical protein
VDCRNGFVELGALVESLKVGHEPHTTSAPQPRLQHRDVARVPNNHEYLAVKLSLI